MGPNPYFGSTDILSLVDGTFVPPNEHVESYTAWKKRDHLLLSWLHATLISTIFVQVIGAFTSQTNARLYQVKHELSNLRKGSLTISEYMEKIKAFKDLIFYALDGLSIDYDSLITSVTSNPELLRNCGNRARGCGCGRGQCSSIICWICNKVGHNALHGRQHHNFTYQLDDYPYDSTWYPDTGATNHMTANASSIMHPSPYNGQEYIVVENGNILPINNSGTTYLHIPLSNFLLRNTLNDRQTGKILHEGPTQNELFPIKAATSVKHYNFVGFVQRNSTIDSWHKHPGSRILDFLLKNKCFSMIGRRTLMNCGVNKSYRLKFYHSNSLSPTAWYLIHTYVRGPAPEISCGGYWYCLIFVDDYSKYTWIFPLKSKSEIIDYFKKFKNVVESLFSTTIKFVHSDSGCEDVNKLFSQLLSNSGIQHHLSCPHTLEQNGLAECKHRSILKTGLTLLHHGMPRHFWMEAFSTADSS
ncbi:hypothetical protein AMTRI_Chr01g129330 [Amborella trichopoda]